MKSILILVFSNLKHDARVKRQISFLKKDFNVYVACFDAEPDSEFEFIQLKQKKLTFYRKALSGFFLFFRFYKNGYGILYSYKYLRTQFKNFHPDLTIANDVETLPLAFSISKKGIILLDAHEYAPRHFEDKLWWRIFFKGLNNYLCKKYIPKVKGMITIGKGLAKEYEKNFGISPTVITNATQFEDIKPSLVTSDKIRLVHHGIVNSSRKPELMVTMMKFLDDRFTLDLILMIPETASAKTKSYFDHLKSLIAQDPRIRILPPVKSQDIVKLINQYDIGVFIIPPINFNYANTLPNKIFEYIQARLALAVGPTPEIAEIVNHYGLGVVADNFSPENIAYKISQLTTDQIRQFKIRASITAKDLCAEKNETIFRELITSILNKSDG